MLLSSSHLVRRSCSFLPVLPSPTPDLSHPYASQPWKLSRLNRDLTPQLLRVRVRLPEDFYGAVIDPGSASARAPKDEKRPTCSAAAATKPPNQISRRLLQSEGVLRGSDDQRAIRKECRHSQGQTGRMWERSIIFCLDVKACAVQMWSNCFHR